MSQATQGTQKNASMVMDEEDVRRSFFFFFFFFFFLFFFTKILLLQSAPFGTLVPLNTHSGASVIELVNSGVFVLHEEVFPFFP